MRNALLLIKAKENFRYPNEVVEDTLIIKTVAIYTHSMDRDCPFFIIFLRQFVRYSPSQNKNGAPLREHISSLKFGDKNFCSYEYPFNHQAQVAFYCWNPTLSNIFTALRLLICNDSIRICNIVLTSNIIRCIILSWSKYCRSFNTIATIIMKGDLIWGWLLWFSDPVCTVMHSISNAYSN